MLKRDDLPEMTLPLVILLAFLASALSVAASKLSAVSDVYASLTVIRFGAALLIFPLIVCFYSMIILLWRRVASLFVTAVIFFSVILSGSDLFSAASITLASLFVSYMFAVSMIARESRFRRMTSLAMSYAVSIALVLISAIGLEFGTFDAFADSYMENMPELLRDILVRFGYRALSEQSWDEIARMIIVKLPAMIGLVSMIIAFLTDHLTSLLFRVLDCENVFIEITSEITMPLSYAVVYGVAFFLTLFTSYRYNPLIYEILSGIVLVMMLPCALVGVSEFARGVQDMLSCVSRERFLTVTVIVITVCALGISNSIMILSVMGVYFVIKERISARMGKDR